MAGGALGFGSPLVHTETAGCRLDPVAWLAVILGGMAFGAGDQYLGTVHAANALGWWTVSVSLLSSPWLVLPFFVGWKQSTARRAAAAGLVVTAAALAGYFVMTLSPVEGARFTIRGFGDLVGSQDANVVAGTVVGPLCGWLGYRWRTRRWWPSALLIVGSVCLEPVVVAATGRDIGRSGVVWTFEILIGVALGVWFVSDPWRRGHARRRHSPG